MPVVERQLRTSAWKHGKARSRVLSSGVLVSPSRGASLGLVRAGLPAPSLFPSILPLDASNACQALLRPIEIGNHTEWRQVESFAKAVVHPSSESTSVSFAIIEERVKAKHGELCPHQRLTTRVLSLARRIVWLY
ncbi:hypothetical protein PRIC2_009318 [Phytophthora ramorum]